MHRKQNAADSCGAACHAGDLLPDYPKGTMEGAIERVREVLTICVGLLCKLEKTMYFFPKTMLQPGSLRAYDPFSITHLLVQHHIRGTGCCPCRELALASHPLELMELLQENQTPLICLSSSSRDQKSPSPMETGAGISEAIRAM